MNLAEFLGFRCPDEQQNYSVYTSGVKYFRNRNDCQRYFICLNGRPRLQNCGVGRAFDETTGVCDAAVNVTGWWADFPLIFHNELSIEAGLDVFVEQLNTRVRLKGWPFSQSVSALIRAQLNTEIYHCNIICYSIQIIHIVVLLRWNYPARYDSRRY